MTAQAASASILPRHQLALKFPLRPRSRFEHYVAGANTAPVQRLQAEANRFECLWLFGSPGVGKTHLLQATLQATRHVVADGAYLPARRIPPDEASLQRYGRFRAVLVDDVEAWLGHAPAERELYGIYNELARAAARLVFTASRSPRECEFALPDLASRLCAAECYELARLSDEDMLPLLINAAQDRGLRLSEDVVRYLLSRVSRDQKALLDTLSRLDHASLTQKRGITVPFVKQVLGL